jgi:hypothetical protein
MALALVWALDEHEVEQGARSMAEPENSYPIDPENAGELARLRCSRKTFVVFGTSPGSGDANRWR